MSKFEKGHPKYGGRRTNEVLQAPGIRHWARSLFEDPRYQLSVKTRLMKGRLPPQVECKLLAYAYGEPARDITLNANLRGLVSVVHEHVEAVAAGQALPAIEASATPAEQCISMQETVIERMDMHAVAEALSTEDDVTD
jgi:hypothetical protein